MTDRIAVVTGAASGIGRAVALGLARTGARVVAADLDLDGATAVSREVDGITPLAVDVADPDSVTALAGQVATDIGTTNVLVNCAGWDRTGKFLDSTPDFADKVVGINYLGQVHMCRAFLPGMVEAGEGGKVVNVASDAGRVGSSGETIYAGAKGGVIAMSKSLAREMARHAINVNVVCPGPTDTPLFAAQDERLKEALIRAIPFRRLAKPEEVADAVLFFASDAASYVTGQVLSVSGGLTMAG
ncbi:SDR family NAD(P)-dependent oxidoreductase [Pseudonocardia dioxanivorans]|jgi:2-hydroxycyclohexanecarboxyl-CoA dehydrogenase|uniref:3-oxoacyl-(Acyl-carrier-protein) reductase n=1 Tax=Pseudonocardia dioxanivorans (strain ATCC 55486 / DSM 44775 / JCM 13855 / CB1190) TaxID=675635 RepID=F4CT39_PSEUX|nr:SDR family NAD(P)-dependent oxidoreductase [Pseudonocardia dioxanivorans]AEA26257.1 3-oxoacyl-(acyl-carrier-protein) reductase [Pseudonocardia dioxanivorans CB1190]